MDIFDLPPLADRVLARLSWPLFAVATLLPRGGALDRFYALALFLHDHKRLPRRQPLFTDRLFFQKWDGVLDHDLVVMTSDKELAKYYSASILGPEKVVPTLAVLRAPAEVDAFSFPEDCFAKGTASSGDYLSINGPPIDRARIKAWLKRTHYRITRERNYRPLTQKIIVEPNLRCLASGDYFSDLRLFTYRGRVRVIMLGFYENAVPKRKFYDREWREIEVAYHRERFAPAVERPPNLDAVMAAAEELARPFDLVRIDIYTDGKSLWAGEITHCHGNTRQKFASPEEEKRFSEVLFGLGPDC